MSRRQDDVGVQIVACIAGFLSIAAFAPQAWAVYTSGSPAAKKPELGNYFVFSLALLMWSVYGGLLRDTALVVTNVLQLAVVVYVFFSIVCARKQAQDRPASHHEAVPVFGEDGLEIVDY